MLAWAQLYGPLRQGGVLPRGRGEDCAALLPCHLAVKGLDLARGLIIPRVPLVGREHEIRILPGPEDMVSRAASMDAETHPRAQA
jgi:hypothetical protein